MKAPNQFENLATIPNFIGPIDLSPDTRDLQPDDTLFDGIYGQDMVANRKVVSLTKLYCQRPLDAEVSNASVP